jgi:AraC-like DNA-binding protein
MATDIPLADLASAAGFADQSHLNRTFKRQIGMTPAAFRRSCRSR